jgi:hypothetical protein
MGSSTLRLFLTNFATAKTWRKEIWYFSWTFQGWGWRLVKHPSIGSCRWRSLPHGLQCDKCGNISIELPLVKQDQNEKGQIGLVYDPKTKRWSVCCVIFTERACSLFGKCYRNSFIVTLFWGRKTTPFMCWCNQQSCCFYAHYDKQCSGFQ